MCSNHTRLLEQDG